jgi:hypothetical protein
MGYRGDDGARERAAWGARSPRQSSGDNTGYGRPGQEGRGYDGPGYDDGAYAGTSYDAYSQDDGYGPADYGNARHDGAGYDSAGYDGAGANGADYNGARHSGSYEIGGYGGGRGPADDYGTGNGYGTNGYSTDSYDSRDYRGGTGYDAGSYGAGSHSGGYPASDYGSDDRGGSPGGGRHASYDSGAYQSAPYDPSYDNSPYGTDSYGGSSYGTSSHTSGEYPALGQPSGGYPALGGGGYQAPSRDSGGYRALGGGGSGGYPALGNGSGSGSGGYRTLGSGAYPALGEDSYGGDGNDWYGRSGPQPMTGFSDTSAQLAVRDPVRGYPPEPGRADHMPAPAPISAPTPAPAPVGPAPTGQQPRYNESEYVSYPGYDGMDDEHGQGTRRGYDYDDYAGYESAGGDQHDQRRAGQQEFETRLDQVAVDYDAPRGYGQALQGDDFDGGRHDDYAGPAQDVLASPDRGARRRRPGGRGTDTRDPNGPAGPAQDGSRSAGGGKPKRRRTLMYSTVAGVLVLVVVAAFGGYKYYTQSSQDSAAREANQPLPTTSGAAGTQQCVAQLGQFCHIELRTDDPAPLTLSELYLPAFHSQADNADFLLQADKLDTNCSSALFGSELTSQVQTGKCNQVLRATYLSGDQTIMGTIGVVNLNTTNQAHYAGKVIGQSDFILPLSTPKGLTAKLGQGIGVVEAEYKGHYLILTWAEFTNLKTPNTTAQTQELENWENALVAGTANIYLSQRMINGDGSGTNPSGSPSASPSAAKSTAR